MQGDFECFFDTSELPLDSAQVTWMAKHEPLSVSVCSNIPGYMTLMCIVTNGNAKKLVGNMHRYLEEITDAAYVEMFDKFSLVLGQLQANIADALISKSVMVDVNDEQKHPLEKLWEQLEEYLMELPVIGVNSGKYDINAIKCPLIRYLQQQAKFVVKKNNSSMCFKTLRLKFLDIVNYLAPGFSYKKFLKAFGCSCSIAKGFLLYEWIDLLDKLEATSLPPHEAFYSKLKRANIAEED